jgi:hypothetical protein
MRPSLRAQCCSAGESSEDGITVDVGQVATGLGLMAYGTAFYAGSRWYVRDDGRLRRMAESRWWLDRRVRSRIRHGEVTQQEWFAVLARRQRAFVKWALTIIMAFWIALCAVMVVRGLRS